MPISNDRNPWASNVTRWLNAMLSVSTCDPQRIIPITGTPETTCTMFTQPPPSCTNTSAKQSFFARHSHHYQPVFCMPLHSIDQMNTSSPNGTIKVPAADYHKPYNRPQEDICDNAQHKMFPRDCASVYRGSGRFATLSSGAKGNTQTTYSVMYLKRLLEPSEPLDLLLWDYGTNDEGKDLEVHRAFATAFFPQVLRTYRNLSAFGFIYWPGFASKRHPQLQTCPTEDKPFYTHATVHYSLLKYLFTSQYYYHNLTLLTSTGAAYCTEVAGGCSYYDFFDHYTSHGHDLGNSRQADFFIWQLVWALRSVLKHACSPLSEKKSSSRHHSHERERNQENHGMDWIIDNDPFLKNQSIFLKNNKDKVYQFYQNLIKEDQETRGDKQQKLSSLSRDTQLSFGVDIIAAAPLSSPVIGQPIALDQVAILCAPGEPVLYYDDGMLTIIPSPPLSSSTTSDKNTSTTSLITSIKWVHFDINTVLKEKCAGWMDTSRRLHSTRPDADHAYSPTVSASCLWGAVPPSPICKEVPSWVGGEYPRVVYNDMPMVKTVDLVFRVNASLSWTHVCFKYCKPRVLWKQEEHWYNSDEEKEKERRENWLEAVLVDAPVWNDKNCYLLKKKKEMEKEEEDIQLGFYYLWIPANKCFPTPKKGDHWGAQLHEMLTLLRVE